MKALWCCTISFYAEVLCWNFYFKHEWVQVADHIPSNFLKTVFHKFYLVHSWILCPILCWTCVTRWDATLSEQCKKSESKEDIAFTTEYLWRNCHFIDSCCKIEEHFQNNRSNHLKMFWNILQGLLQKTVQWSPFSVMAAGVPLQRYWKID